MDAAVGLVLFCSVAQRPRREVCGKERRFVRSKKKGEDVEKSRDGISKSTAEKPRIRSFLHAKSSIFYRTTDRICA